jgi:hypothetical protein
LQDIEAARFEGLQLAVQLHTRLDHGDPFGSHSIADRVIHTAGEFATWLLAAPARLALRPAPFTFAEGPSGPGVPTRIVNLGGTMSVTITDTEEVTYACEPEDSRGFPVTDTLTWSEDSAGAVITITAAADGLSAVVAAVAPGTANISVTDGTLSGTDAVTVTTGPVAQLVLTPGAPVSE